MPATWVSSIHRVSPRPRMPLPAMKLTERGKRVKQDTRRIGAVLATKSGSVVKTPTMARGAARKAKAIAAETAQAAPWALKAACRARPGARAPLARPDSTVVVWPRAMKTTTGRISIEKTRE